MYHNEHEQNEVHIDRGGLNSYVNVYKQVGGQSNVNQGQVGGQKHGKRRKRKL